VPSLQNGYPCLARTNTPTRESTTIMNHSTNLLPANKTNGSLTSELSVPLSVHPYFKNRMYLNYLPQAIRCSLCHRTTPSHSMLAQNYSRNLLFGHKRDSNRYQKPKAQPKKFRPTKVFLSASRHKTYKSLGCTTVVYIHRRKWGHFRGIWTRLLRSYWIVEPVQKLLIDL